MLEKSTVLTLFLLTCYSDSKIVQTSYGKLEGATIWSEDKNHKYTFKSVPFAKPPVGDLRFALPEDPDSWEDVLDASNYSAACMSKRSRKTRFEQPVSEDCLYLNIFTSENCLNSKCPVIVYFHGGAFHQDSAVMFPDDFILERYVGENIVFTIPAYRLGVFGQLYFGPSEILTENLLMFDAVQSLNYIHKEIENFGGDPNKVTIMGHSTGGTFVDALGFSKMIDPDKKLFQQMIGLSAPGGYGYEELAIQSSIAIAKKLGCFSDEQKDLKNIDVENILMCMRKLEGTEILLMQRQMIDVDNLNFTRIIRGAPFMELSGKISDFKKNTPARNLLSGTTETEFIIIIPYTGTLFLDLENPSEVTYYYDSTMVNHTGKNLKSDSASIFVSTATYAEAMVNAGGDVYLFETRQKPFSGHVTDMQYFIGIHREEVHTSDMDILDSFYSKLLVNFTKYGRPSPTWDKYDPVKMNFLNLEIDTKLGITPKMENDYNRKTVDFWLKDMVELDRNISAQKRLMAKKVFKDLELQENFLIYEQWWFYGSIMIVFIVLFVVFFLLKKSTSGESQPLISH